MQQPPNYPNDQPPQGQMPYGFPPQGQVPYGFPQQPMQPGMYPQQPGMYPPPPQLAPKKKHTGRNILVAVIVVIVVLGICGGIVSAVTSGSKANSSTTTTTTSSSSSSQSTTQGSSTTYKVGQTVSVGNTWQIVVEKVNVNSGSGYSTPQKASDVFLEITISAKNITSQEQTMSSLLQWSLQDSTGQKYNESITDTSAGSTLDGKVEASQPLKGVIVYEVPKSIKSFTLSFQNDIISAGQTLWNINV